MTEQHINTLVVLNHLWVENANAVSSPFTWGFPAPSAFTGFGHALQRHWQAGGIAAAVTGVGMVCHGVFPQVAPVPGRWVKQFALRRHPVRESGESAPFIEEGRIHLDVSLVLGCAFSEPLSDAALKETQAQALQFALGSRLAGGSVLPSSPVSARHASTDGLRWDAHDAEMQANSLRALRRRLLPGFALVARPRLLAEHLAWLRGHAPEADVLDAMLDLCALHSVAKQEDGEVAWPLSRRRRGWLVPVPVGYASLSALYAPGEVRNSRDPNTPMCFVESMVGMAEWCSPHRISFDELLWRHAFDADRGLYRVSSGHAPIAIS